MVIDSDIPLNPENGDDFRKGNNFSCYSPKIPLISNLLVEDQCKKTSNSDQSSMFQVGFDTNVGLAQLMLEMQKSMNSSFTLLHQKITSLQNEIRNQPQILTAMQEIIRS